MIRNESRKDLLRERRRRQKRRRICLIIILSLLLVIGAAVWIVWNVFTVENVEVKGNEHYSDEQIEKFVLNDEYSWNSLYVLLKYKFVETKEIPFVDTMEISLKDPTTLQVRVYEKGILGYVYISTINQNAYFDKDGFVVEISKEVIEGIPRVEGLNCEKVVLYEKLPIKNEPILKNLLTATQSLKKNEVVPEQIAFAKNGDITLHYDGIEVRMGGAENLTKKILRLPHILPELSGMTGILHVENWTENTTDIVFERTNGNSSARAIRKGT